MLKFIDKRKSYFFLFVIFLLFFAVGVGEAQNPISFSVDYVESSLFPVVDVYLSVSDNQGFPLSGLDESHFALEEDGQAISDFEINSIHNTQHPLALVLAIDVSGSMIQNPEETTALEQAIEAGKIFVDKLSDKDEVAIVSFSDQVTVVEPLTSAKEDAKVALDTLAAEGNTALYDAIFQGIDLLEEVPQRKVVIVLTDGMDSGISQHTPEEVVEAAGQAGIPIYPIGFGNVNEERLRTISDQTGGLAQIEANASDLTSNFLTVLNVLREQYKIRYQSQITPDGAEHDLSVTFTHLGETYTRTQSFVAQPYTVTLQGASEIEDYNEPLQVSAEVTPALRTDVVQFFWDEAEIASLSAPPYQVEISVPDYEFGEHTLKVLATDINGNTTEEQLTITTRDHVYVEFSNIESGDRLRGAPDIAIAVDAVYPIQEVVLLENGNELATFTEPPFKMEWPLYNVEQGEHLLVVTATDTQGHIAKAEITVEINPTDAPPPKTEEVQAMEEPGGSGGTTSQIEKLVGDNGTVLYIGGAVVLLLIGLFILLALRKEKEQEEEPLVEPAEKKAVLRELEGRSPNQVWELDKPEIKLGRKSSTNDIPLDGLNASRRMAVIRPQEQGYVIFSLAPHNPVIVNGNPMLQQHLLQPGDVLTLGDSEFQYEVRQ